MQPTHKRIERNATCLQWDESNTAAICAFLSRHAMIGEIFQQKCIMIYAENSYRHTMHRSDWVIEGEDGAIRFYKDETFKVMYERI